MSASPGGQIEPVISFQVDDEAALRVCTVAAPSSLDVQVLADHLHICRRWNCKDKTSVSDCARPALGISMSSSMNVCLGSALFVLCSIPQLCPHTFCHPQHNSRVCTSTSPCQRLIKTMTFLKLRYSKMKLNKKRKYGQEIKENRNNVECGGRVRGFCDL